MTEDRGLPAAKVIAGLLAFASPSEDDSFDMPLEIIAADLDAEGIDTGDMLDRVRRDIAALARIPVFQKLVPHIAPLEGHLTEAVLIIPKPNGKIKLPVLASSAPAGRKMEVGYG